MKKYICSLLIISALFLFPGCQRDDICPGTTDTTPFLIIRFYENQDPFDFQPPQNLSIRESDNEEYVSIRNNRDQTITYFRFTGDSIAIPLRTDNDVTSFEFTKDTPPETAEGEDPGVPGNTDVVTFSYGREEVYLNRACAFKINYVGLNTDLQSDESNWIQDIQIEQLNIEDQNQAHVSIFF